MRSVTALGILLLLVMTWPTPGAAASAATASVGLRASVTQPAKSRDVAVASANDLLQRAHAARLKRDYANAHAQYSAINQGRGVLPAVRQEAGYWIGICSILDISYLQAIRELRWFLDAYGKKSPALVTDATYVLARTYELVGDFKAAEYYYRQCLKQGPTKEKPFFTKAQAGLERLVILQKNPVPKAVPIRSGVGPGSALTPPNHNPDSPERLGREQLARVKLFAGLVARRAPIKQVTAGLTADDLELPVVKQLLTAYQDWCRDHVKTAAASASAQP